jgi:uncharacterized protein (DUF1778 family)
VYKVRRRLINFRVTEEEFERLKVAAALQGSRCLSEFARFVMLGTAGTQACATPESFDSKLSMFDRRLAVLESHMARLVNHLDGVGARSNGDIG